MQFVHGAGLWHRTGALIAAAGLHCDSGCQGADALTHLIKGWVVAESLLRVCVLHLASLVKHHHPAQRQAIALQLACAGTLSMGPVCASAQPCAVGVPWLVAQPRARQAGCGMHCIAPTVRLDSLTAPLARARRMLPHAL